MLQRFLCMFGIHDWDKWGDRFHFGYSLFERRSCKSCGITTERKIGWWSEYGGTE